MTLNAHPDVRSDEDLFVYSDEDLQRIASDMFVDLREVADDDTAADAIEIMFERLTDDFYSA